MKKCNSCGKEIDENNKLCPNCGNKKGFSYEENITENISFKESGETKGKNTKTHKKFFLHEKRGFKPSGNIKEHPEGVDLYQCVDRKNNLYKKKVVDIKTGKIIKDVEEPLSEHKK